MRMRSKLDGCVPKKLVVMIIPVRLTRTLAFTLLVLLLSATSAAQAVPPKITELITQIENYNESRLYSKIIITAIELQELANAEADIASETWAFIRKGKAYASLGANEEAFRAYEAAVKLFRPSLDPKIKLDLYLSMTKLLIDTGRTEDALEIIASGIAIAEKIEDKVTLTALNTNKGVILLDSGKLDEAEVMLRQVLVSHKRLGNEHAYGVAKNNIGMIYKHRKKYDVAMDEFYQLLKHAKRTKDQELLVYALLELGDISRILFRYDEARDFLEQALFHSAASKELLLQYFSHSYMATFDMDRENVESAEKHQQQAYQLQQTMSNKDVSNRAELLKVSVDVMERDHRIALLEKDQKIQAMELQRNRTLLLAGALGILLLFLVLCITYRRYKSQSQVSLQLSKANEKLDELAATDFLTGLPNRRSLLKQVTLSEDNRRVRTNETGLIMVDIDHFKMVNDEHGHDHGDAVLVEVSRRLKEKLRSTDSVARWGGEEFLVLLPQTSTKQALIVAEALRQNIAEKSIEFKGTQHQITATMGVALYGSDDTFEQVLRQADDALYRGK